MKSTNPSYAKEPVLPGIVATIICALLILVVGKLFINNVDKEIAHYKVPTKDNNTLSVETKVVQADTAASLATYQPGKEK